jgi:Inner membrane protein YgaP-like, transmembrane domain
MVRINSNQKYRRKNMNPFIKFMASTAGRIIRIIAGIVLIALGLLVVHGVGGTVLAVVGLVPLVAGLFDFCVFAPLFGAPLGGKQIRSAK